MFCLIYSVLNDLSTHPSFKWSNRITSIHIYIYLFADDLMNTEFFLLSCIHIRNISWNKQAEAKNRIAVKFTVLYVST